MYYPFRRYTCNEWGSRLLDVIGHHPTADVIGHRPTADVIDYHPTAGASARPQMHALRLARSLSDLSDMTAAWPVRPRTGPKVQHKAPHTARTPIRLYALHYPIVVHYIARYAACSCLTKHG
jgi:hypothetical protein